MLRVQLFVYINNQTQHTNCKKKIACITNSILHTSKKWIIPYYILMIVNKELKLFKLYLRIRSRINCVEIQTQVWCFCSNVFTNLILQRGYNSEVWKNDNRHHFIELNYRFNERTWAVIGRPPNWYDKSANFVLGHVLYKNVT